MKKINFYTPILIILFLLNTQISEAQFFKKLKQKFSKKETIEKLYVSDSAQIFKNWDLGASDIIATVFTESDPKKRTHIVGDIAEDGSFSYKLPDSIGTFVPIGRYAEECTNAQEVVIKNAEVKMGLAKLYVGQNKEFTGSLHTVSSKEAVYNSGSNIENNGEKGDTYLLIYADGEASIHIKCEKKFTMRNQKGQAYKDQLDAESAIAIDLKKGWNLLRSRVTENIPVGMGLHFTKKELTIVDALPNDSMWVYQPTENKLKIN
jgi:hypothetical protein